MWQVIPFPVQNSKNPQENTWGDIAAHFEWPEDLVQEQIEESHGVLVRTFPNLFMTPWEVIKYLEKTRGRVEEIEKHAA